jgi:hypothetical protein
MTVTVTSPVTCAAQTGNTGATFTAVADVAPNAYSKQYAFTALAAGTFANVDFHGASKPFTVTISRPQNLRSAPVPNPVTGVMGPAPKNVYQVLTRKGVVPGTGQNPQIMLIRTEISVVAGSDLLEPEDVRAGLGGHIGTLNQISSGLGDTLVNNLL